VAVSERWFRFYSGVPFDPKLLRLSDRLYRLWTYLLSIAAENDGFLPSIDDLALMFREKATRLEHDIQELIRAGLFEATQGGRLTPHNWNARQYKRDVSTERVKRFRERQAKPDETVAGNAPETETETETETEEKKTSVEVQKKTQMGNGHSRLGTRLPENWLPSAGDCEAGYELGLTEDQIRFEHKKFTDYWRAKSGSDAAKADWNATFRNWLRYAHERSPRALQAR
jgi:hypothetical protein